MKTKKKKKKRETENTLYFHRYFAFIPRLLQNDLFEDKHKNQILKVRDASVTRKECFNSIFFRSEI